MQIKALSVVFMALIISAWGLGLATGASGQERGKASPDRRLPPATLLDLEECPVPGHEKEDLACPRPREPVDEIKAGPRENLFPLVESIDFDFKIRTVADQSGAATSPESPRWAGLLGLREDNRKNLAAMNISLPFDEGIADFHKAHTGQQSDFQNLELFPWVLPGQYNGPPSPANMGSNYIGPLAPRGR
jgi:hypothetical protein